MNISLNIVGCFVNQQKAKFVLSSLQNLTTGFPIMKDSKVNVEAIEVDSHHVFVELASRSCSVGQLVALEGHIIYPTSNESLEASGKIVMIKEITEGHEKIGIELHSFDKKKWGEFIHFLNKQQDELDKLFRSMRDDE